MPVVFKGRGNLVDGLRQIFFRNLGVPLQARGQGSVRQVRRAHIRRGKARVAIEDIRLSVKAGDLGVIADLDLSVGQLAQLLDGLYIRGSHVRGRDDPQIAAVLCEGAQLVDDQS